MLVPNKKSARWYASRYQDMYTNLGFDYHGRIFEKTLSKVILQNSVNKAILSKIEPMISYLIDTVKQVRLHFMFSLDKNDDRVN